MRAVRPKENFQRPPVVYTNDLRSAEFRFQVTDMEAADLSEATATTLLYMRDGSFFQNPKEDVGLDETTFSYTLKENEGNHAGIAKIQLVVCFNAGLDNEQNFPSQLYEFEIANGLETKVAPELMIQDWTTLTRDARAYIDQFVADEMLREAQFDNAQFDRNVAFVADQNARDTAFGVAQTQRNTDFGTAQTNQTNAYAAAETARDLEFGEAEALRAAGYDADHSRAGTDHTMADNDHTLAGQDRTKAAEDRTAAASDRTAASNDRTRAAADHTRAEADSAIVTTFDGRVKKLESNDEPMHYDKVLGEYVNVGKYWDAYRDGKIYTTEFNNYEVSPSPTGTKKDANAGLVAVPSTNLVAGQDDYANIGLFKPVEVNAYVDANDDYRVTAIKGDGRFKRDGTNGDVYIMNMLGYIKRFDTPTTWGYSYSDTLHAGFSVLPEAVKPDGTVRPFLLHAKYIAGVGSDGKLASISGVNPEFNSMSHDGQITKFKAKGEQYSGKTTHDDFWMKLMLFLKYATTNSEAVMRGCISYYLQYQPSIYESGVSRVVLTNAQANALVVGSRVSVGNYAGGTKTDDRGNALVHNVANRVKITSIVALPDGLNSAVNVDAPAFDTNATTTISTVPWSSGACDNVLGNDGSPISNASGKEPLIINGIETMVGGYEVIQNLMIYNDNTNPLDYKIKVYVCYDAKQYKAGSPSADYKLLSVLMAQTNNTWQYISKLGVDPNHPTALIPIAAAASSTTGFADGVYTNAPTTGYRVWLSLGSLLNGSLCGFFYVIGSNGLGSSSWYILGRLSATGRSRGELA
ncbi:hypothetical protein [uncultured Trichococcus sp.]|uniref:hypothetical protein n=1 Tax=uncultured Trichococcus sp. TaxID=189665 RepID=UPI002A189831|nr:hypothetical protein [uncultured Trichococcus sp.]